VGSEFRRAALERRLDLTKNGVWRKPTILNGSFFWLGVAIVLSSRDGAEEST
jgi:hypothetical protein